MSGTCHCTYDLEGHAPSTSCPKRGYENAPKLQCGEAPPDAASGERDCEHDTQIQAAIRDLKENPWDSITLHYDAGEWSITLVEDAVRTVEIEPGESLLDRLRAAQAVPRIAAEAPPPEPSADRTSGAGATDTQRPGGVDARELAEKIVDAMSAAEAKAASEDLDENPPFTERPAGIETLTDRMRRLTVAAVESILRAREHQDVAPAEARGVDPR